MAPKTSSILVVDDDQVLARSVCDILRINGYASREAHTGGRGIELMEEEDEPFSVALVDLRLPDMDGLHLVSRLHDLAALTEVVILTGNASMESAVAAMRERSCDYLVKPVAPELLLSTVRRGVRRWQHRWAEEELQRDRALFEQVVEALSDVVMVLSLDGTIQYQSPAAPRILGYGVDEAEGQAFLDFVEPRDRERVRAALSGATDPAKSGRPFEFRFRRPDETWCMLEGLARSLPGPEGQSLVVTCRDITERRRLENELRQTQRMDSIGRLASGIAHDFNNQLTAILASVDLAGWDVDLPPSVTTELDEIRKAANRAAGLTRQLLIFSRKDVAEPRVVDISERVEGMLGMLRRLISARIALVTRYAKSVPPVRIDPTQLEQMVVNLVVNARHALPSGGTIPMTVSDHKITDEDADGDLDPGAYATITVTDDGVGMTEDVVAQVFEPFFTTKEASKGTGLGLSTCYGIVTGLGGHIEVTTEVGAGTSFRILLPAAATECPEREREGELGPVPPLRDGDADGTILLVEDDDAVRRGMERTLIRLGYEVLAVSGGEEALSVVHRPGVRIDLVLIDLVMPGMAGPDVVREIRRILPDVPALFVSGYANDSTLDEHLRPESGEFLRKPIELNELRERVRALIGR
ncbi:MAG TPA: response regulator [Longimicrobiales bacterium]